MQSVITTGVRLSTNKFDEPYLSVFVCECMRAWVGACVRGPVGTCVRGWVCARARRLRMHSIVNSVLSFFCVKSNHTAPTRKQFLTSKNSFMKKRYKNWITGTCIFLASQTSVMAHVPNGKWYPG